MLGILSPLLCPFASVVGGGGGGWTPWTVKDSHAPPPQGVRVRQPPDGSEVLFFKKETHY